MNSTKQLCECGKVASFLGYCPDCFANETRTVHEERRASMVETEFKPGDSVGAGKFTLIEKLGEGGMGSVWLARDEHLSGSEGLVEVALKFIGGGRSPNKFTIDLLRKEVLAARKLSHPHIVDVYDWHTNSGEPEFYSMEYLPGLDLKELLKRQPKGRFTWKELNPLVEQLFDALEYAHEKFRLIHRDLKPANILVAPDGTVKLTDFGLAESASTGETFAATVGGTLLYASPGQRAGNAPSVSDDIYSLSAVLYHLLTGHPPYAPEDLLREDVAPPPPRHPWYHLPRRDRRDIPAEAAATLMRCLRVEEGGGAPDMAAFRRWWRTGPPLEFETRSQAAQVWRILKGFGTVGAGFLLLTLLYFLLHLPLFAEFGPRITRFVDPVVPQWIQDSALRFSARSNRASATPAAAAAEPPSGLTLPETNVIANAQTNLARPVIPAVLVLQLDDTSAPQRWDLRVIVSQFRDQQWVPVHAESSYLRFADSPIITRSNLTAGLYRVEVGEKLPAKLEDRSTRYWVVDEVELTAGPSPVVRTLGMKPGALAVYASHRVPFEILDPWGKPASISGDKFEMNRVSTVSKLPFRVELPFPLSTPRAGHFQLRFPEENMRRARLEPQDPREVFVVAGVAETVELTFAPWQQARMDATWVSPKSGIEFLPVGKGLNFLGGRTEVTVGQYRMFAEETQRPAQLLESVTTNGWEEIGRTWKTAFTKQTEGHPVVGVSWDDAKAFCDWLTQRERALGKMGANQRYALPTAEQWTAMAAGGEYPWGGGYPPKPEDGNYAGIEVLKAGWPEVWNRLTLETEDPVSVRTVAVGSSRPNGLGFLDLGGNVAEWCDTWYRVGLNGVGTFSVPSKRLMDDRGGQTYRVVRGGSWFDSDPDLLKTAAHWAELPTRVNDRLGFRLVLIQEEGKP